MTPEIEKRIKAVQAGRVPAGYKRTAGGVVPNEWEETPLEKCLVEYKEKTTKPNQYPMLTSARTALMLQSDYYSGHQVTTDDNVGYNVLPRGYVTFRSRSDDGRFKFNENNIIDKGIISYFYPVFSFNNHVDHKYMLFLLNETIYRQMFPYNEGTAQMVLSFNKLKSLQYSIPPLSEQKKIAEILATQDRVIELKEKLIAEKQSQKKYLMSVLLGDDFKKPFKLNGLTIDKKKWEKVRCEKILVPSGKRNKENLDLEPYAITNEYGFVPQKQAHDDFGYMKNADRSAYIIVSPNSFGYNPARINVGSIGFYDGSKDIIVSSLYEVFKTTDSIDNRFLWHWFKSDIFPKWIDKLQEGSVRQYFYYDKLSRCEINLPSLPEQKAIADVLSAADEEISLLQKGLEQEKFKKKSLMQLLLTGLVRVA